MKIKDVKQNKSGLKSANINEMLVEELKYGTISRERAREITKCSDSQTRAEISLISMFYPVISYSTRNGYGIVDVENVSDKEQAEFEYSELDHTLHELNSRIKVLKKRMKSLIGAKKVLEKRFGFKGVENGSEKAY